MSEILNDKEKAYLKAVIEPFRWHVVNIIKNGDSRYEVIAIKCRDKDKNIYYMFSQDFKKGTKYKGMELNKEYSLEDLNL